MTTITDEMKLVIIAEVEKGKEDYRALAEKHGLIALPSATNFVAIDVGHGDKARAILKGLDAEGVFIRMPGVPVLDRCIRVTVGAPDDLPGAVGLVGPILVTIFCCQIGGIVAIVYAAYPVALHAAAGQSVTSHLLKLEREGRVRRASESDAPTAARWTLAD